LLGACGGGLLSQHPEFDAARQRLPERYSACDEGSVGACTELAFELEKHSLGAVLPTVLALHRIACTHGSEPSCLELALREFPREPSALGRLKMFCARDREMRACELLTREGDEDAAKVGCELRTERGCWTLNEIWKKRRRAEPARDFFSSQCSQGARVRFFALVTSCLRHDLLPLRKHAAAGELAERCGLRSAQVIVRHAASLELGRARWVDPGLFVGC
jgi:hypothetical protein